MTSSPNVVHSELLGHLVRADPWHEQGRSSYALACDALGSGDFASAEDFGRITVQEAQEAYDLFATWLVEIPQLLTVRGVPADIVEQRIAAITSEIGDPELEAGWAANLDHIDEFADACRRRDVPSALRLLERARSTWQCHHDRACDTICALFDLAAALFQEEFVGEIWDTLLSEMYKRSARIYHPDNLPWARSMERLLLDIFEATRGHLTGPDRDGSFSIIEETDRWVITFAPCGSGGRTLESVAGTTTSDDRLLNRSRSVTTGEHDWAWNTKGVCLYCAHCCQLQQRAPIQRLGFPLRVIDPPTQGQTPATCSWSIYKDPNKVPDDAYTRVGFDPPIRRRD